MIRGTTPRHIFTLPFDVESIATLRVIYRQDKKIILTKTDSDVLLSGNSVEVLLSQEDTLSFRSGYPVEIQLRVLLQDETAMASDIYKVSCGCCLEDEVICCD